MRIWALIDCKTGRYVPPIEEAGDPFLAFRTEADAIESANDHYQRYDLICRPTELEIGQEAVES